MQRKAELTFCSLVLLFLAELAFGVTPGQKVDLEAWIISRQEQSLAVRTLEKQDIIVIITAHTKVQEPRGVFKVRKTQRAVAELLPGLRIRVKGVGDTRSQVIADSIRFSGDDFRTAQAIGSGVTTLQNQVAANTQQIAANHELNQQQIATNRANIQSNQQQIANLDQRFSDLNNYLVKYKTSVYFAPGSSTLSARSQEELRKIAREAQGIQGYRVQVKGHADSSGTAALNQDLSMRRAQAVMAYLQEAGNIPLTNILTPAAMGESRPKASNNTSPGRAENRRVEVTLLINRGLTDNKVLYSAK
jgi:outer membrane protein OmpA-like peptidoglycan-associated protein